MISDREETRYWITARYPFQVVHKSIVIFLIFSCNLRWFIVRRAITDETDEKIYYSKFCERRQVEWKVIGFQNTTGGKSRKGERKKKKKKKVFVIVRACFFDISHSEILI